MSKKIKCFLLPIRVMDYIYYFFMIIAIIGYLLWWADIRYASQIFFFGIGGEIAAIILLVKLLGTDTK